MCILGLTKSVIFYVLCKWCLLVANYGFPCNTCITWSVCMWWILTYYTICIVVIFITGNRNALLLTGTLTWWLLMVFAVVNMSKYLWIDLSGSADFSAKIILFHVGLNEWWSAKAACLCMDACVIVTTVSGRICMEFMCFPVMMQEMNLLFSSSKVDKNICIQ